MRLISLTAALTAAMSFLLISGAGPALAFDCGKASDKISKAICADPAVRTADGEMTAAYEALKKSLPPSRAVFLRDQQRAWLETRNNNCTGWDNKAPVDNACMLAQTRARTAALNPRPELALPGAPVFAAAIDGRIDPSFRLSATLIYPQVPEASTPGLKRLNAAIRKAAEGDGQWRTVSKKDMGGSAAGYQYMQTYTIPYASPDLVSVALSIYAFTGGAHGMSTVQGVNVLTKLDRPLKAGDIVAPEKLKEATAFCRGVLGKIKSKYEDPATDSFMTDDAIAANMKEDGDWIIGKDGATVHYNPYDIGAYAEGAFDCLIPWADLKGFAPAQSPLPFP
ncbi:MAG: lysozyme inhibitor LprI family protein [Parvibaculaceae bacterium]|nr:lysozyme inhibitor LprI family protein [Parvibaculaceae bacterium]